DLYVSLAERRLEFLPREHSPEWIPGAYEFPREFKKLTPLVVDFLREVGRPSELEVSPVLRGYYFTGVQAVLVVETAAAAVMPAGQDDPIRSATGVFAVPAAWAQAAQQTAPTPGSRRVPRWDFLPRVFREVVYG